MIDFTDTIKSNKSNQLNYDDLIAGKMVLRITDAKKVSGEQPMVLSYEGGEGKPYKPCLGMRRFIYQLWGKNGEDYIGRSIEVFGNPTVKWGGEEQGGIQINAMSHIDSDKILMLTVARGKRIPYKIKRLELDEDLNQITEDEFNKICAEFETAETMKDLQDLGPLIKNGGYNAESKAQLTEQYRKNSARIRGK